MLALSQVSSSFGFYSNWNNGVLKVHIIYPSLTWSPLQFLFLVGEADAVPRNTISGNWRFSTGATKYNKFIKNIILIIKKSNSIIIIFVNYSLKFPFYYWGNVSLNIMFSIINKSLNCKFTVHRIISQNLSLQFQLYLRNKDIKKMFGGLKI
jgi:hypothetical protein